MLVKQAKRFINIKVVKKILQSVVLTAYHEERLNKLFTKYRCKELENMHSTIAKFVLYNLNNYEGRLRRLRGTNGTSLYTQLLRYGKKECKRIYAKQNESKTPHFKNKKTYWTNMGYSDAEAIEKVKEIQTSRNAIAVEVLTGSSMYTCRSMCYWMVKGYSEEDAKLKVSGIQTTNGLSFYIKKYGELDGTLRFKKRIEQWQASLNNKTSEEKKLINLKKSPTVAGHLARGITVEQAKINYNEFCKKQKAKNTKSFSNISQDLFIRLEEKLNGEVFYYTKNYEYLVGGYRVDFYHKSTKTVVEFYGDFYHRNPMLFAADMVSYNYSSAEKWESDRVREEFIKLDPKVEKFIIVWELDYRKNPVETVENILTQMENINEK